MACSQARLRPRRRTHRHAALPARRRPVFAADASSASASSGFSVRRSSTSTEASGRSRPQPARRAAPSSRRRRSSRPSPPVPGVPSPVERRARRPEPHRASSGSGASSTTTGSGSRMAAASKPFASAGVDGIATHTGRVHVVRLGRVVVELRCADAAAVRHAHGDGKLHRTPRPPAVAPDVIDQLVERRVAERVVLQLTDGAPAAIASPMAVPMIPASASRVSTQRSGPNRSRRPAVARKTPPARRRPRPSPSRPRRAPARRGGSR